MYELLFFLMKIRFLRFFFCISTCLLFGVRITTLRIHASKSSDFEKISNVSHENVACWSH